MNELDGVLSRPSLLWTNWAALAATVYQMCCTVTLPTAEYRAQNFSLTFTELLLIK